MYLDETASAYVEGAYFSQNHAFANGGAISFQGAALIYLNTSTLIRNSADGNGGAACFSGAGAVLGQLVRPFSLNCCLTFL